MLTAPRRETSTSGVPSPRVATRNRRSRQLRSPRANRWESRTTPPRTRRDAQPRAWRRRRPPPRPSRRVDDRKRALSPKPRERGTRRRPMRLRRVSASRRLSRPCFCFRRRAPRVSGRWTTSTPKTAPVRSTAASLHPVRYAGSTPTTVAAGRIGGADNNARRFAPKSITARRRAASRSDARASRSIAGASNLFTPSATAASTSSNCARGTFDGSNARVAARVVDPRSNARETRRTPADSARSTANVW